MVVILQASDKLKIYMSKNNLSSDSSNSEILEKTGARTGKHSANQWKNMPENIEAEQALLAALLHDNYVYEQVSEILSPENFALPVHQKIYHTIITLIERSQIANPITIAPMLVGDIEDIREYLAKLATSVVTLSGAKTYAKQIYDTFLRRRLIHLGEQIVDESYDITLDRSAIDTIESAEQHLFDLAVKGDIEKKDLGFSSALGEAVKQAQAAFERDSHIVGVTTGLHEVDKCLGGLHPSDLIIVAGRPSMGKTALAVNIAFNAAKAYKDNTDAGAKVMFFSLEMSAEQLAMRILGQESEIPSDRIRRGAITARDFDHFSKVTKELQSLPLFIDDTPALTIASLRTRVRRLYRQEKIGLIVIDYLQLLSAGGHNENRVQELSLLTRSLKALAKEMNVPVIAVSQLSRAVEQREDKHPQLSDLRESGTIEQDADIVTFVYREAYYIARNKPADGSPKMEAWQQEMSRVHGQATLMIAKQRHGPVKNITLHFNEALTKFGNAVEGQ